MKTLTKFVSLSVLLVVAFTCTACFGSSDNKQLIPTSKITELKIALPSEYGTASTYKSTTDEILINNFYNFYGKLKIKKRDGSIFTQNSSYGERVLFFVAVTKDKEYNFAMVKRGTEYYFQRAKSNAIHIVQTSQSEFSSLKSMYNSL